MKETRTCTKCNKEKDISCYNRKGEYCDTSCSECRNEHQREYRKSRPKPKTKMCTCCKVEKKRTEFTQTTYKNGVKYHMSRCKECVNKSYEPKPKFKCIKCNREKTEKFYDHKTKTCSSCKIKEVNKIKAKEKRAKDKARNSKRKAM